MGSGVTWFGMGTQDRVESIEVIGPRGGRVVKFSATAGGLHLGDFARKSEAICAVELAIVERRTFPCGDGVAVLSEDWTAQNWIYCGVAIKGQDVLNISRPRAIGDSFWTVSNRAGEVVLQTRFKPALTTIAKIALRQQRYCVDCQMILTTSNPDSVCVDCQCKRVETESPAIVPTQYQIKFTQDGQQVQLWTGYASHGDAYRAIRDADSCIPFCWEYVIEAQPHPALMGTPQ